MSVSHPAAGAAQTHVLQLGSGLSARMEIKYTSTKIRGVLEYPDHLARRHRRQAAKWARSVIRPLHNDPREMMLIAVVGGAVKSIGVECNGFVGLLNL